MRAGLLNKQITLLERKTTTDGYGASVSEWSPLEGKRWARVTYGASGFGEKDGEAVYKQVVSFQMRYSDSVKEYMRVLWDGRQYRITGIERYPERGEMKIQGELISEE